MLLTQAVYFSTPRNPRGGDLGDILAISRRNNAALGVTGALVLDDIFYFQLLEGPRNVLSHVIGTIQQDTRHLNFTLALFRDIEARAFTDWTMAGMRFLPGSGGLTGGRDPLALSGRDLHDLICRAMTRDDLRKDAEPVM
ncbi:MAG: BLUF domain-containing protein [Rhodobacteraceae bacterium]|nr:MAG: BLUF domain-containing protein [Paracoccaceae bacterium]